MKQTAVEWLIEKIENNVHHTIRIPNEYFEQAKAMEKEQIIDSHIAGMEFIAVDPSKYKQDANEYYNETHGGDK
jgi:hypothetical protein